MRGQPATAKKSSGRKRGRKRKTILEDSGDDNERVTRSSITGRES